MTGLDDAPAGARALRHLADALARAGLPIGAEAQVDAAAQPSAERLDHAYNGVVLAEGDN